MAWDFWNNLWGGESEVLKGRLEEMTNKPYAQQALAVLNQVSADGYDAKTERTKVLTPYLKGVGEYLQTVSADKRFEAFKQEIAAIDATGTTGPLLSGFDKAPANVQQALMNAVTANPNFVDHVANNGTGPMASLLTEKNLKTYGNQIADILNDIANKPGAPPPEGNGYDFKKLDTLGNNAKAFFEEQAKGDKADKEKLAKLQQDLMNSVRDAGGNIPAFANLNGEMLLRFLHNIMTGDLDTAINEFGNDLGLKGDQLANFQELARPLGGIMKFMGQDYYEYAMHYGPRAVAAGKQYYEMGKDLSQGPREEYRPQVAALDTGDKPVQLASADYSDVSFTAPANVSGQGLDGVTKMTAGTANDYLAGKGITSTVTPDQERAVAAYDAQTETIRRMSNQNAFAMA